MYKTEDESVMHIFFGCSKLAQRENRMRQVNMGKLFSGTSVATREQKDLNAQKGGMNTTQNVI